jgi:hypothetical protein
MVRNMVKSSNPNAPTTWLIFLCPRTRAKSQIPLVSYVREREITLYLYNVVYSTLYYYFI